jgi:hypothetical protein
MHFKNSGAFRTTVPENLVRPPAFEVAATPNTRMPHIWNFQCAIDPPTTSPFRRAHIPVRMIIEGDQDNRFGNMPQPQCSQMVKIAGPIEQEFRRNICLVFPIELFNQARRRAETQLRSPVSRLNYRKTERFVRPRVIQIEMKRVRRRAHKALVSEKRRSKAAL